MGATGKGTAVWKGPVVPFEIDPNFDNPNRVREAIRNHIEARTNVRFVRRSRQGDFVRFVNGQACSSQVGAQGEANQPIVCVPGGPVTSIVHEIGHALGLIHEHQRPERDTFVEVHEENVEAGKAHNFERHDDGVPLTDYDLRSLMHYPRGLFSRNGQDTLTPKGDPMTVLDTSPTLTDIDVEALGQLYPHVGVVRRGDSGENAAGGVREIAVANGAASATLVTAVRTSEGTLRLILWRVNAQGGVLRVTDSKNQAGKASSIAIALGRQFVTAVRSDEGRLRLIGWHVTANQIERDRDTGDTAGTASLIRILALTPDRFVTACRLSNGTLRLITWQLESDGRFTRLFEADGDVGSVSEISFAKVRAVGAAHFVAATARTAGERMVTVVFRISSSGRIRKTGDSHTQMGDGTHIESGVHDATGLLVVSCRTSQGILRLITLSVSSDGSSVRRRGDSRDQAGSISRNALLPRPIGMLSAVRASGGQLTLIRWRVDGDGTVRRLGDSTLGQAGEVGVVRLAGDTGLPEAPVVTCVQTDDDLRLVTWDDEPAHGELQP